MFCIGCGKKGVRWPHYEPIACTMRCLAIRWLTIRDAAGFAEGEYCGNCGDSIQNYGHECEEQQEE
jgi:hypothetical protein